MKTASFSNDLHDITSKDNAITALIHLGYLGFDAERSQAYLPNYEVATAYESALETGSWQEVARSNTTISLEKCRQAKALLIWC